MRLEAIRTMLNLSQDKFALDIGTTKGTISKLENGKQQLTMPWIEKITKTYPEVKPWMFFHDPQEIRKSILGDDVLIDIVNTFECMSHKQRSVALSLMKTLEAAEADAEKASYAAQKKAEIDAEIAKHKKKK